jgi:Zn-dependent protease with chaperone function
MSGVLNDAVTVDGWHEGPLHMAGDFLFDGAFRNLWPMFLIPLVAALISDRTARLLPRTPSAWLPAAILAAAPALTTIGALVPALTTWDELLTWRGVILMRVTPAIAVALIGYALVRMVLRQREVGRLFLAAAPAGPRLAAMAQRLGIRALELPTRERECFVAGLLFPTAFISRGALDALDDDELEAALCHERAHIRGRDTAMLFILSLLRDLAPWGRGAALEAFKTAREAIADRSAAANAGSLSLAAALVALARPGPAPAAVLSMAKDDNLRWRMQALLDTPQPEPQRAWGKLAGGLGLNVALVAWPVVQFELMLVFCTSW